MATKSITKPTPTPKAKFEPKIIGQDKVKKAVEFAITENIPVLLIGETGTGKTTLIHELALKHKRPFNRFNMTGETSVDDFVGKTILVTSESGNTITRWEDGMLIQAMKTGAWLVVDEINVALPEILLVLNSLLDDGRSITLSHGEKVECHEDFRFFATMNPTDEYAGTKELNKALMSRFGMVHYVSYASPAIEAKIVMRTGVTEPQAKQIVDTANTIRKAKSEGRLYYTCSTRDLIHWGQGVDRLGLQQAFEVAIVNKAHSDKDQLIECYSIVNGEYQQLEKLTQRLDISETLAKIQELDNRQARIEYHERALAEARTQVELHLEEARNKEARAYEEIRKEVIADLKHRMSRAMAFVEEA